ncbi:MAG TPA: hypothetical protein VGX91_00785, partial [Candidatus Cybelea sp.]|nr:hypothetical protein [Candidatus Cybelea sp.]
MTRAILPQPLPSAARADNRGDYAPQADGRLLKVDPSKCFASPCPGCSNCDTLCELETVVERAREFVDASQSTATRRAYASDWRDFDAYCSKRGLQSLPATPQTLTMYLTDLAGYAKLATIKRRLAAISQIHKERGLESPTAHEIVRRVVRGIGRTIGASQAKKSAVTLDYLRAMLLEIHGDDLKAKRDRAILLLGFAAALRRSE